MRILILYTQFANRKTVTDSINCFRRYQNKYKTYYYFYHTDFDILPVVKKIHFDIVIFHNSFACLLWDEKRKKDIFQKFNGLWKDSARALLIQDEYVFVNAKIEFIKRMDIDVIFTLAKKETAQILYPENQIGKRKIVRVLTGYVDEDTLKTLAQTDEPKRDIDIGYRANRVNYSLGEQGAIKSRITEKFLEQKKDFPELTFDIKNTFGTKNLMQGMDWFMFLKRCRTMAGCLGGASILDADGTLYNQLMKYKNQRFSETAYQTLQPTLRRYKTLDYTAISPRCLECAMTKTCQLLVEGDYEIMKPGVHYIEIKKDFSNLHEVIEKTKDKKYCEEIAERTYQDLILSGKYTYQKYVRFVLKTMEPYIRKKTPIQQSGGLLKCLLYINNRMQTIKMCCK